MSQKVRFALVGCGSIGKRHIAVVDSNPNSEIIAICDKDENKCIEQSALYSLKYFVSYDEMLSTIKADVVSVVTPHHLHAEMTIKALKKGFHVLVEKPMALNVKDCIEMNKVATEEGKKLWVVKQNRFNVPVRLATEAIRNGHMGKLLYVKCDILWNRYQGYYDESEWRGKKMYEGGALFTQASHFIDLLVWWCGEVKTSQTYIATLNHKIETEDTGIASLVFDSGVLGSLNWTTSVYNKNFEGSITIIGEYGTIKIGGQYMNKIEYWDVRGYPLQEGIEFADKPNSYGKYQGTSSNHDKVISALIQTFDNKLAEQSNSMVEGFEGIKSIDAIEKIYGSAIKLA